MLQKGGRVKGKEKGKESKKTKNPLTEELTRCFQEAAQAVLGALLCSANVALVRGAGHSTSSWFST